MPSIVKLRRDGRRVCNDTCFKATTPPQSCRCICGGRHHGAGSAEVAGEIFRRDVAAGVWGDKLKTRMETREKLGIRSGVLLADQEASRV